MAVISNVKAVVAKMVLNLGLVEGKVKTTVKSYGDIKDSATDEAIMSVVESINTLQTAALEETQKVQTNVLENAV